MAGFLIYMAKVAAVLAVFGVFYRLILGRERAFGVGRGVLLLTLVLGFLLPLCEITITKTVFVEGELAAGNIAVDVAEATAMRDSTDWWGVVFLVYGLGCAAVVGYMTYSMICVGRVVRGGLRRTLGGGVGLCVVREPMTPFSWFGRVVISQDDYAGECGDAILAHEKAHIEQGHCYDLLLVNLCCALQWFNPAAWMLRKELLAVHEYQADSAVLVGGYDARKYQLLLIKKAVGSQAFAAANNLNNSTLKKRIAMMMKNPKGSVGSRFRLFYLVPLVALSLFIFSKTVVVNRPQPDDVRVVSGEGLRVVRISIGADGGVTVQLGDGARKSNFGTDSESLERYLAARIDEKRGGEYVVRIQAAPRVQMGMVTDVKCMLRRLGVKTYIYDTPVE